MEFYGRCGMGSRSAAQRFGGSETLIRWPFPITGSIQSQRCATFWWDRDVAPHGQRLLMLQATEQAQSAPLTQIDMVLNWFEELKRRVPPPQ